MHQTPKPRWNQDRLWNFPDCAINGRQKGNQFKDRGISACECRRCRCLLQAFLFFFEGLVVDIDIKTGTLSTVETAKASSNWKTFSSQDYFDQAGVQTSEVHQIHGAMGCQWT